MRRLRVADIGVLAPGEMTTAEWDGTEILLARIGDEYFALDNLCSHAEGYLDMGYLMVKSCEVRCPLHDGRFDLRSGKATAEPATEPVAVYRVIVEEDGIYIEPDQ